MGKLAIVFLLFSTTSFGQVHSHAIGLRASGGYWGYGPELSYQLGTGDKNRLELDLGYFQKKYNNGNGWGSGNAYTLMAVSGIYHWDWNIIEGLNWYIGPGAQLIVYNERYFDNNDGIYLGLGGQIGIEYDFSSLDVPVLVGLDYRPMFLFSWNNGVGQEGALSIRYLID